MKFRLLAAVLSFSAIVAAVPLAERFRSERSDRRVAVAIDWTEIRLLETREGRPDIDLLKSFRTSGITNVIFTPVTVSDRVTLRQLTPSGSRRMGVDPLDVHRLSVQTPTLRDEILLSLQSRGVHDLKAPKGALDLERAVGSFADLRDIETGFDDAAVQTALEAGLAPVYRLNSDPWTSWKDAMGFLLPNGELTHGIGVPLFNMDELPGGADSGPFWASWIRAHGVVQPFFEFHPTRASTQIAWLVPQNTVRAHTISTPELRDLHPPEERLRWRRAVEERSCRFLLVHAGPFDSSADFSGRIKRLTTDLQARGWVLASAVPHRHWSVPSRLQQWIGAWAAFITAISFPIVALMSARAVRLSRGSARLEATVAFLSVVLVLLVGGSFLAALATTPATQLQVATFRGIKASFVISWLGGIFILYRRSEILDALSQFVRRRDLLVGLGAAALVGYVLIRSGNASAGWKSPVEQKVRDVLETLLVVRPRFKEFGFGHPLLFVGLFLEALRRRHQWHWDARPLLALGVVGMASVMNTFCHLHSPIARAYSRSIVGFVLGLGVGMALTVVAQRCVTRSTGES